MEPKEANELNNRSARQGGKSKNGQTQTDLQFEQALEQLEGIVRQLESGDVPLEKALDLFQEGMRLARHCSGKLDAVERKIEMLVEENGAAAIKPFTPDEGKGDKDF